MKILVTGCSTGLGLELLANQNHEMFAHYRSLANPTQRQLVGDVTSPKFLSNFEKFLSLHSIEVLINNAGIYQKKDLSDFSKSEIDLMVKTNLLAPIYMTQVAIRHFQKLGKGIIVNINSLAGKKGTPGESVYSSTKFGLRGFSNSIRFEVKDLGIEVLDVYLGGMRTRMTESRSDFSTLIDPKEAAELILSHIGKFESMHIAELEIRKQ